MDRFPCCIISDYFYTTDRLSLNAVYNHMGYKTFTVGMMPDYVEYERPRNQLDAQVAYTFLKKKTLKVKLNMTNLLDNAFRFYTNSHTHLQRKTECAPSVT